jgi:hypothetical protein
VWSSGKIVLAWLPPDATALGEHTSNTLAKTAGAVIIATYKGGNNLVQTYPSRKNTPTEDIDDRAVTHAKQERKARPITVDQIDFDANSPIVNQASWSAGSVHYFDDAGAPQIAAVVAGNTATWTTGRIFIYWDMSNPTILGSTTSQATATSGDRRIIATYRGGTNLVADRGRAKVDHDRIKDDLPGAKLKDNDVPGTKITDGSIGPQKNPRRSRPYSTRKAKWTRSGNVLSWTAFTLVFENDSGAVGSQIVDAGSVTYSGTDRYMAVVPGSSTLGAYSSRANVNAADGGLGGFLIGIYSGGNDWDLEKGRATNNEADIDDDSVSRPKIRAAAIGNPQVEDRSLQGAKLLVGAVDTAELKDLGVTGGKASDRTFNRNKIIVETLSADEITPFGVTSMSESRGSLSVNVNSSTSDVLVLTWSNTPSKDGHMWYMIILGTGRGVESGNLNTPQRARFQLDWLREGNVEQSDFGSVTVGGRAVPSENGDGLVTAVNNRYQAQDDSIVSSYYEAVGSALSQSFQLRIKLRATSDLDFTIERFKLIRYIGKR